MNLQKFIYTCIAVFAVIFGLDYLVHHIVLVEMYNNTAEIWRAPDRMIMWPMFAGQILFALIFVYLFTRNYEAKGMGEGFRYGLYIGLILAAMHIGAYAYLPVPLALVLAWIAASMVKCILLGFVAALVYRE